MTGAERELRHDDPAVNAVTLASESSAIKKDK
jgi:hypothetical protein